MLAVAAAGLLPSAHYSPSAAVSSQSIVRHDEARPVAHVAHVQAAPVAHVAHVAPIAYAAPSHYAAAPAHYAQVAHAEEYVSIFILMFTINSPPRIAHVFYISFRLTPNTTSLTPLLTVTLETISLNMRAVMEMLFMVNTP